MIAAILLSACLSPPLFDTTGPVCSLAAQLEQCRCSECMTWDAVPGALGYRVQRVDMDGTTTMIGTPKVYGGRFDEDGNWVPMDPQELWCVAFDSPWIPIEGRTYVYRVAAWSPLWTPEWSPYSVTSVTYIGAPYLCLKNGIRQDWPCQ